MRICLESSRVTAERKGKRRQQKISRSFGLEETGAAVKREGRKSLVLR